MAATIYGRKGPAQRLRALRRREKLTVWQMAQALGYRGNKASLVTQIKRWEAGKRPVPEQTARLLMYMDAYGNIPENWYGKRDKQSRIGKNHSGPHKA